jgi:hypothetical protein
MYDCIISDRCLSAGTGAYLKVQRYEKLFFVALHVTTQYKALGTVQKRIRLKKVLRVAFVDGKCVFLSQTT